MAFKAIIFKPGQKGEIREIENSDFRNIVEGSYETTYNKHRDDDTTVVAINGEGAILGLPRNRGYHGTFIVFKTDEEGDFLSFTDEEANEMKRVIDKKKNFKSKNKFLETFFEEKDVPAEVFSYERENNFITLGNYDVIDYLLGLEDKEYLRKTEMTLREIDFRNGNVNHFLEYMGRALADHIAETGNDYF